MRILDSEAHPLNPSGIDCCYPTQPKWRYPYIPGASANLRNVVAESVRKGAFDNLTKELLERMDRHGVEKTVIMRGNFPARNADLAAIVARHPDRFASFASWDLEIPVGSPPREGPKGLEALERGFTEHGCVGAGEFGLPRFEPLHPEQAWLGYVPTLELCRKHNRKPVMFHTGYDGGKVLSGYKNPIMLEPLAFEFPDVPILVAHMGKYDTTFFEYAMMLARKCSNVYLTTSNAKQEFIERAVEEIGAERLIFGSDWSMQHGILGERQGFDVYEKNLDAVRKARLGEREKALILGENLAALLGI
jgi:predicted TIM-barrel fold metal-dependent hydrolase